MQLANRSDAVYNEYLEALDATTLTLEAIDPTSGVQSTVTASFNKLCSRNRLQPSDGSNYAIRDKQGRLVVEDDIYEAYNDFRNDGYDDPYLFALNMALGGNLQHMLDNNANTVQGQNLLKTAEENTYTNLGKTNDRSINLEKYHAELINIIKKAKGNEATNNNIYDREAVVNANNKDLLAEYDETMLKYRAILYSQHADDVAVATDGNDETLKEHFNMDDFNYYLEIYQQIKTCGGCVSIDFYDGMDGDAANDSEWLKNMIQCGELTVERVKHDKTTNEITFNTSSPSSDSCLTYTQTSKIDSATLAKAEAKYEHDLGEINKKDKQYDLTLTKLETERTALTTEYESVKGIIKKNVEKSFNVFNA